MQKLRNTISNSKRQLTKIDQVLDELYADITATAEAVNKRKAEQLTKMDVIEQRITNRMLYLNRLKNKPLMETTARLDELSRILDWLDI